MQLFFAVFLLSFQKKKIVTVVGKVDGNISEEIIGKKGFGYDQFLYQITKKKHSVKFQRSEK